jgi:hypothetical protein
VSGKNIEAETSTLNTETLVISICDLELIVTSIWPFGHLAFGHLAKSFRA